MILDRRVFTGGAVAWFAAGSACSPTRPPPTTARSARPDLYLCEGCEAVEEASATELSSIARLAIVDVGEPLRLEGVVRKADGLTPAPGVVIYAHHTNAEGLYANGGPETVWSRKHGRLRGWALTDSRGRYAFETIKPAPYPSREGPAHVHLTVGEPGRRPYYVDDVVFDGEFGVDAAYRAQAENRGGSGIVRLARSSDGWLLAQRDIQLEIHPA